MAGPLKVGVIGVGQRGLAHVRALTELQDEEMVTVAALVDPFAENLAEEKIKKFAPGYKSVGVQLFDNVKEMVDNAGLDAVWFVIPPNQHKGEIEYAAEHGLHILAEKPQSLYLDDILRQDEAISKAGVISTAGFQMRMDRGYTDIRNYLADKWVAAMTMIAEGGVEGHSVKHTHTEAQGGPAHRVWTADRRWSGTSMVEAGIHQTDIMRYWTDDEVDWVRGNYVDRPEKNWESEGDNPIYYTVTYGFKKGHVATLIFTKPARSYYNGRFDTIIWEHGTIKLEDDYVDYHYEGNDWTRTLKPPMDQVRKVVSKGPHTTAMGAENTKALSQVFVNSIVESKPELLHNTFHSSINSLASVLAANVSSDLGGEKIKIDEFIADPKYSKYRRNPTIA